jgi:hypothetical protein
MSVSTKEFDKDSVNKKKMDLINRFAYYGASVQESREIGNGPVKIEGVTHSAAEIGHNTYHYMRQMREPYNNQGFLSKSLLTSIARESLVPKYAQLHDPLDARTSEKKSEPTVNESFVDIVVLENMERTEDKVQTARRSHAKSYGLSSRGSHVKNLKFKDYCVYVIHFPTEKQSQWTYVDVLLCSSLKRFH